MEHGLDVLMVLGWDAPNFGTLVHAAVHHVTALEDSPGEGTNSEEREGPDVAQWGINLNFQIAREEYETLARLRDEMMACSGPEVSLEVSPELSNKGAPGGR